MKDRHFKVLCKTQKSSFFTPFFIKGETLHPFPDSVFTSHPALSLSAVNSHQSRTIFRSSTNSLCSSSPALTFCRGHQGHQDLLVFLLNFLSPPEPAVTQLLQSGNNREWQEHPRGNTQRIAFLFKNTSAVTCTSDCHPARLSGLHSLAPKSIQTEITLSAVLAGIWESAELSKSVDLWCLCTEIDSQNPRRV